MNYEYKRNSYYQFLALGSITFTNTQQPAGYFFKEFTSGKVSLKFTSEIIFKR